MTTQKFFLFATLLCTALFFASCSKETIEIPTQPTIEGTVGERSTTVEIEVSEVSSSDNGTELFADFSANFDFTEAVLEPVQYFNFVDGSGNTSTLSFDVNSFAGSNGSLNVELAIGSNNLNGLSLTAIQDIIIEDLDLE